MYCGLCASDPGALAGQFGDVSPGAVAGHEIVGEVIRVGPKAEGLAVGDIVGIGAQCDSCRECEWCKDHEEQFCPEMTFSISTPLGPYRRGAAAGRQAQGGFAKFWRGPSRFAIKVPEGLDPAAAAPLFCGGITVFSPLNYNGAGTRAKRVGVVGIGGLGHMAIMLAKAMGAEVTAISRGEAKKADALKLGATKYIATSSDPEKDFADHKRTLDLIICTISKPDDATASLTLDPPSLDVNAYVSLLRPRGKFTMVGFASQPIMPVFQPQLIHNSADMGGSQIGSPDEIRQMLDLAAKHNVLPWIQKYNMDDINQALVDFKAGKPAYRFVLVNTDNGGKM